MHTGLLSFTPGFSPVENHERFGKPFQRFPQRPKTAEAVYCYRVRSNTGLKPGENEKEPQT
jgi:hypothetical protein